MVKKRNAKKIAEVKDIVVDKTIHTKEKIQDAAKKTGRYIDKNPRKAAAIAAGVGAAVGAAVIASAKHKKKKGIFG